MDTLFSFDELTKYQSIGHRLHIIIKGDKIEIYKNQEFIEIKAISTDFDKRLAVVELTNNYGAMKKRLAEVFSISRQTIDNWLGCYDKYGAQGLINNTKESWKKNQKRFKGNKARELEKDRLAGAQELESQEITIDFNATPQVQEENVKTDLYTGTYSFEDNRYAGSMVVMGMIEYLYRLSSLSANIYGEQANVLYLFLAMHITRTSSIEQLKVANKEEFGRIIGQKKLESMPNLWSDVHQGIDQDKSQELHSKVFSYQAVKGLVGLNELFLDGHFIPYYGKEKTHKGFFTQRDLMVKGQTQMFVHDCTGRVVYFETQEGKGDIVQMLKKTSEYISGLNQGQKPLIAIDREVWGVENFIYLSNERVVTWEKFCEQDELQQVDIKLFDEEISKNGNCWQLYQDKKEYIDLKKNKIELRRVIMHNKKTGKRLCLVSTDKSEDKTIIAEAMLGRWGSNENTFKYMGERTNMHYNPVIEIAKESQHQEIDNPQYKKVHKQLTILKNKLGKKERELGRKPATQNKDGSLRQNQLREQLQQTCLDLRQEIQKVNQELDKIPKRIDVGEIGDEKFKEIDKEGVNLWSVCESMFWNSRKELIERFSQFLPNQRDTIPVLEALINAPGRMQSTANMLLVKLETNNTPRYKSAQIQLLRYINNLGCHINGKLLQFDAM
jgi:hypothetical protein